MGKKEGLEVAKVEASAAKFVPDWQKQIVSPTKTVLRHPPEERDIDGVDLCKECSMKIAKVRGRYMTVKSVCIEALCAALESKEKMSGKKKLRDILFAERLENDDSIALSQDECVYLKQLVDEAYKKSNPVIVARVVQALDPAGSVPEKLGELGDKD
jgi:hypothetical protein